MHDEVERAVAVLRDGGLVAFPTETVYGLGADATNPRAVRRLYAVKRRPADHPVIVHVGRVEQVDDIAGDVPPWARALAGACWPGPLTLVVNRRPGAVCDEVTGGRGTVGVRVPAHPLALELLRAFGRGVAAPSANRFGRVSPTTAQHVHADLGRDVDLVLDGGACAIGVESTIVSVVGATPVILREGGVRAADIERITGLPSAHASRDGEVAAPGTLPAHYAPRARVEIVDARDLETADPDGAVVLALADVEVPEWFERLDPPADVDELARVLYARLRDADARGARVVLIVPPPPAGIGAAVLDRVSRAARAAH